MSTTSPNIMSWSDIQKKYPDQWVGLTNVTWINDATVGSAEVCYTESDMSSDEMALKAIRGEIDTAKSTSRDKYNSIGALIIS